MKFLMDHANLNVTDLDKSLKFYSEALGLQEVRRKEASDGSFILVFISDENRKYNIELTWLKDKEGKYELGDNESHIAFITDDIAEARKLHTGMDVICYDNPGMGIYFIEDPDGYWFEIVPARA